MNSEINIMKAEMERDGLFTTEKLMHLKYQMNGIRGYILQKID